MAVFERIDLALVRDILAAAAGAGDELRAVTFENQPVGAGSIPDACISGSFTWWFETKTERHTYASPGHATEQLDAHKILLVEDPDALLFVVTPDAAMPGAITEASASVAERIIWLSFRQLASAIEAVSATVLSEQTRFLLAELVALFEVDGLLSTDDTVIVAARSAWPEYHRTGAYVCQPDRSIREDVAYLGFYADGAIQPVISKIHSRYPAVLLSTEEADRRRAAGEDRLADLLERLLLAGKRVEGEFYGVFLLSGPDDPESIRLAASIVNDTTAASGRTWAWTLSQRYTSTERLRSGATVTSEL
jgi:hypothetical protein